MANFGLSKPWIAKYNPETDKYSGGFKCGKAISTSVTPNYNEAALWSDNQQTENVTEFKNATVNLGVDRMPLQASSVIFGHAVGEDGGEVSKTEDFSGYVGYGFITAELLDGVKKYRACILRKVQFKEGEESFETKGDSIVFKTPTLSGVAMGTSATDWRKKSPYFDTETEADLWIQVGLNVKEKCSVPVASVEGGEYAETKSVVLATATSGAKIKYTTDGTTPRADNGTEYKTAIAISSNTGLRAVAYKEGAENSDIMTEEYFIQSA